jgi:hypothetical protein
MAHEVRANFEVLDSGRCEPLKMTVHGVLLATMGVCAAYNAAAWLRRRQRHLAINAVLYTAGVFWERCHVIHHLAACADPGSAVPAAPGAEPDAAVLIDAA